MKTGLKKIISVLFFLLLVLWLIFFLDAIMFNHQLKQHGIHPRSINDIFGIAYAPFLHQNMQHLINNSVGLIILGAMTLVQGVRKFWFVFFVSLLVAGIGVWLFGSSNTNHIGISGIVFGFFGFLVVNGFIEKKFTSILLSVITILVYGGMVWGVLPLQSKISWEGHLFGFIGGVLASFLLGRAYRRREE